MSNCRTNPCAVAAAARGARLLHVAAAVVRDAVDSGRPLRSNLLLARSRMSHVCTYNTMNNVPLHAK